MKSAKWLIINIAVMMLLSLVFMKFKMDLVLVVAITYFFGSTSKLIENIDNK